MAFHAPLKALHPVDMTLPENVVKGAVMIDGMLADWNPNVTVSDSSAYTTIDKQNNLDEQVRRIASELMLPDSESYALMFDEPRRSFVTLENIHKIPQGFMLFLTASPVNYARRIRDSIAAGGEKLEWALGALETYSSDPCFVNYFYEEADIEVLYSLLDDNYVDSSLTALSRLLQSISSLFCVGLKNISWSSASHRLIQKLAILVTGRAKREDSATVLVALQMIHQLLCCDSSEICKIVLEEVELPTLIRHLEKSDERIKIAALQVMMALHNQSDSEKKKEIVEHFSSKPFCSAISGSVLRDGRARERALMDQLLPLLRLIISRYSALIEIQPTPEELDQLSVLDIFAGSSTEDTSSTTGNAADYVLASGLGSLATTVLIKFSDNCADEIRTLVSENAMRVGNGGWDLVPMCLQCLHIIAGLVGIVPSEECCLEPLAEVIFGLDTPVDSLFASCVQLFHRTFREMQATGEESEKVAKVVRQQLVRAAESRPATLCALEERIELLPYSKMLELWKRDQAEKENDQLGSEAVGELKTLLRPGIEKLIRANRRLNLKQGHTFRRLVKGKLAHKDQYWYWRLDSTEQFIIMIETDSDPYEEGVSHAGNIRQVNIKDIQSVQHGEDGMTTLRKGSGMLRGIRLVINGSDDVTAAANSDRTLCTWVDGLNDLLQKGGLSADAMRTVDRLLNIELKLRLVDVPQPKGTCTPPPLPNDFSWIAPHLKAV